MAIVDIKALLVCVLLILSVNTKSQKQFDVSAALHLSVPSLRALANVVVATLPGEIYLGKNLTIDFHLDWSPLVKINVYSVYGSSVDLSNEVTSINVTGGKSSQTIVAGLSGWTTGVDVYYDFYALWGLIDMKGPMNIAVKDAGALIDATLQKSSQGYLFTLGLGNARATYSRLSINTGYPLAQYIFNNFQFLIPYVINGFMGKAISSASSSLNDKLKNNKPEDVFIQIFPKSLLMLKPMVSPDLDASRKRITEKELCVHIVDAKTKKPYYDRQISTKPKYLDSLGLENQVFFSDNLLNSAIKAVALDMPGILEYNTTDDSVKKLMDEIPEIGQVYGDHLDYVIVYSVTPDTQIVADTSIVHLFGNVSSTVYVKMDPTHPQKMVTFYSQISMKMNVTIANYRVFLMIKETSVSSADFIIHDSNLKLTEEPEEIVQSLQKTFIEESSCLNGRFLLPYDLKKNQIIGYASKFLKDGSIRFDRLEHFFVLGFNAHAL